MNSPVALNHDKMINATHVTTQRNNYHMTVRTHLPIRPYFGDDDDDIDVTDIQSAHGRPPFMQTATLIFSHYPTRSQKTLPVRACL